MTDPAARLRSETPARRRSGRRRLAGTAAALLALAAVSLPVGAQAPRLSQAAAVRLADQPALLRAVGPVTLQSALVRTVVAWGPPDPFGLAPTALVWHVTFSGWFRLFPCVEVPIPTAVRPGLLCAATAPRTAAPGAAAAPAARTAPAATGATRSAQIACPLLPRWPIPPWLCVGSWHRTATVAIADATGAWLGATYGPAVPLNGGGAPRVIEHPRNGETIDLTLGQLLLLGPTVVAGTGTPVSYRSSDPAILAPIPPILPPVPIVRNPPIPIPTTAFLAVHVGAVDLTGEWRPVCASGQPCPLYVVLVTLHVRVLLPVDLPPA